MTLPGYVYVPEVITNHIHLGVVPIGGGSPTGFGAHGEPPYLIDQIRKWLPVFNYSGSFVRGWDQTPHAHVPRKVDASPFFATDMKYEVRVSPANFDLLNHLVKRYVYLVDVLHCEDNQDHTPFVKIMWFDRMDYDSTLEPMLTHRIIVLTFLDANTVATNDL